jgi:hypothetical protein
MLYLKRRKRQAFGIREEAQIRSPGHLAWVRGHSCCIEGKPNHTCHGRIEAHHVREGSNGGMGLKCDDSDAVPLCSDAHALGHTMGWQSFQRAFLVNLPAIAAELWRRSPHKAKYERKLQDRTGPQ